MCSVKIIYQILRVLIMAYNSRVSADRNIFITQPCKAFAYIFNVFTSHSHYNIIFMSEFLLFAHSALINVNVLSVNKPYFV